jgi:hypothetical protein
MKGSIPAALAWLFLTAPLVPALSAPDKVTLPVLPVRVLSGADTSVIDNLVNVRFVKGQAEAVLQLDIAHQRVLDSNGQLVVEYNASNPLALQGTVDKWRYVRSLQLLASAHPQEIHIDPDSLPPEQRVPSPPRIYNGDGVTYVVTQVPAQRQVVVFDLDATGNIELLYVREDARYATDTVAISAVIQPLFGVEHIVAVSAIDPQPMHSFIVWLAETARVNGMIDTRGAILEQLAVLKDLRVGLVTEYTCASAANCRR